MKRAEGQTEAPKPAGKPPKDRVLFFTNLKFLFSFIFLLFFAVGNFFVMHHEIVRAEKNTVILGFLEGQYGLVQKTTFLALSYAQSIDYEERKNFRS
ncbi:MAG: hypothetical protein HY767_03350, partial [Candidatus Omnitrophica bacterium]|nr:hypothetical protein [Candidatus Omnitrophota bacterium]